jgi:subtilisin family serine protease
VQIQAEIRIMQDYIILRDLSAQSRPAFEAASPRFGASHFVPPTPNVEVARGLSPRQIGDEARAPTVVGIAPVMRTALVRPIVDGTATATAVGDAWGIAAVGADTSRRSGEGVLVAVLDTGIDSRHPAFAGMTLEERDFSGAGNGDRQGHGTHCAGTIFGRDVDGRRIGIARGVQRALIGKVLGDDGGGSSGALFSALQWAAERQAQVVSMSLGFDFPGMVEQLLGQGMPRPAAISAALVAYRDNLRVFDRLMSMIRALESFASGPGGMLVVAAAGNESGRGQVPPFTVATSLPAAAEGIVSVGAVLRRDRGFEIARFSNGSPQISAPGVGILSAQAGGGLLELNGTSMACPHVAGIAALWWEEVVARGQVPPSAAAVLTRLLGSARPDVFAAGVDLDDRGLGLVTAPQ